MRMRITYSERPGMFIGTVAHDAALLCEVCQKPITKAAPGMFHLPSGTPPKDVTLRAVHKVSCDSDDVEEWLDIETVFAKILYPLGYDVVEVEPAPHSEDA